MFSVFGDIKALLKISKVSIDNWVFKLHYKLSVIILIAFSIVVNSRQYFGDPIDCTIPPTEIGNYVDTYCWFNSYSLVDEKGRVFTQVKKFLTYFPESEGEYHTKERSYKKIRQSYYQWIGIVLLLQAGFFYAPRFLWKNLFEEGRVKELVEGMQTHVENQEEFEKKQERIISYVKSNKGHHWFYALKFFLCEILNFFNVILQIFITDWFLGHAFLNYGIQWILYDPDDDLDSIIHPSYRYFPKETLCDIYSGSPGGDKQNFYQARCILPIHVLNEKIYLFLWFYFIILAIISGLWLIYRSLIIMIPEFRYFLFKRRAWAADENILRTIVYDLDIGDWFIIYQMMRNMDPFVFRKLTIQLHEKTLLRKASIISDHELTNVYSQNSEKDNNEKLNNKGILQGYFSRSRVSP